MIPLSTQMTHCTTRTKQESFQQSHSVERHLKTTGINSGKNIPLKNPPIGSTILISIFQRKTANTIRDSPSPKNTHHINERPIPTDEKLVIQFTVPFLFSHVPILFFVFPTFVCFSCRSPTTSRFPTHHPTNRHRRYQIVTESESCWLVPVVTICKKKE